ncbi:adrenomedullin 2 [Chelonia mydas]|uniref:Adrenomedullin 2 n=1 Tax=Chelonia mydas TaxID=8469 RepID=M7BLX7_CHEMY|nr:adrenomedullin 2 [Chelonia mydas]
MLVGKENDAADQQQPVLQIWRSLEWSLYIASCFAACPLDVRLTEVMEREWNAATLSTSCYLLQDSPSRTRAPSRGGSGQNPGAEPSRDPDEKAGADRNHTGDRTNQTPNTGQIRISPEGEPGQSLGAEHCPSRNRVRTGNQGQDQAGGYHQQGSGSPSDTGLQSPAQTFTASQQAWEGAPGQETRHAAGESAPEEEDGGAAPGWHCESSAGPGAAGGDPQPGGTPATLLQPVASPKGRARRSLTGPWRAKRHAAPRRHHAHLMRVGCVLGTCQVQNLGHRLWQLMGQSGRQDSSPMNPNSPHSYG